MRRHPVTRGAQLVLAMVLAAGTLSCGDSGEALTLFDRIQRIILGGGTGRGTLTDGRDTLLFGPMPVPDDESLEAVALRLQLRCLSGPGVIRLRWWIDPADQPAVPLAEAFGFSADTVDANIGREALDTTLGHFRRQEAATMWLQVLLAGERRDTEVELIATPVGVANCFDVEPNNTPADARDLDWPALGGADSPGVMCELFGDVDDYYRVEPGDIADGLGVETVAPARARTTVQVVDPGGALIGGLTGERVNVVPLLGDIPGIGRLFRTRSEGQATRALLVQITPRIVIADD